MDPEDEDFTFERTMIGIGVYGLIKISRHKKRM